MVYANVYTYICVTRIQVNTDFSSVMSILANNPIAEQSCLTEGLLDTITHMDEGLEKIQKCLDQYLETKR